MSEDLLKSFQKAGSSKMGYMDDTFLMGNTFNECKEEVFSSVEPFSKLGFQIQSEKSKVVPSQEIEFLEGTLTFLRIWQD